jgi:hypothetical protein
MLKYACANLVRLAISSVSSYVRPLVPPNTLTMSPFCALLDQGGCNAILRTKNHNDIHRSRWKISGVPASVAIPSKALACGLWLQSFLGKPVVIRREDRFSSSVDRRDFPDK